MAQSMRLLTEKPETSKMVLMNKIQAQVAEKAMAIMEAEIRKTLEMMGLNIGPETDSKTIHGMMDLAQITVKHVSFDNKPKENGYYFYHNRKLVTILYDPEFIRKDGDVQIKISRGLVR